MKTINKQWGYYMYLLIFEARAFFSRKVCSCTRTVIWTCMYFNTKQRQQTILSFLSTVEKSRRQTGNNNFRNELTNITWRCSSSQNMPRLNWPQYSELYWHPRGEYEGSLAREMLLIMVLTAPQTIPIVQSALKTLCFPSLAWLSNIQPAITFSDSKFCWLLIRHI